MLKSKFNKLLFSRDPALVKRIGEATALEVRATGIPYAFAPCIAVITENTSCAVATSVWIATICLRFVLRNSFVYINQVCRDPRWGRCYESYSEDPKIVQSMTTLISGLQGDAPKGYAGRPYVGGR